MGMMSDMGKSVRDAVGGMGRTMGVPSNEGKDPSDVNRRKRKRRVPGSKRLKDTRERRAVVVASKKTDPERLAAGKARRAARILG